MILDVGALPAEEPHALVTDPGPPATDKYVAPFPFTGTIHKVTIDVSGELIVDTDAEMRAVMARQ